MKPVRFLQYAAIAAVIILYIALRYWNITASCLWFDEIFSVHAAEHSVESILSFVAQDLIHPPLFYLLLKLWIRAGGFFDGGESLLWLRLLPVLFSVLALFPFLALCRELKLSFGSQIIALFFFAVNGSLIKYSQEVRMYSLLLCLSLFSIWLFTRYFYKNESFIPLLIVNILMVYSHYFGWLVVVAEVLAIVLWQREKLKKTLLGLAITAVVFTPWFIAVLQAAMSGAEVGQNIGWMAKPGVFSIVQFTLNLVEPFYYMASSADTVSVFQVSVPLLLIVLTGAILIFVGKKLKTESENQDNGLLLVFFVLPLLIAFFASWILPYSIWGTRHLIIVFAPFVLLVTKFAGGITVRFMKPTLISLAILLAGYAFSIQLARGTPQFAWCAWEKLAESMDATNEVFSNFEDQKVYVFEDLVAYHMWFSLAKKWKGDVVKLESVPGVSEDKAYFLPREFNGIQKKPASEISGDHVLFAFRDTQWNEQRPPVSLFVDLGYHVSLLQTVEIQGVRSFLAEGRKLKKTPDCESSVTFSSSEGRLLCPRE